MQRKILVASIKRIKNFFYFALLIRALPVHQVHPLPYQFIALLPCDLLLLCRPGISRIYTNYISIVLPV